MAAPLAVALGAAAKQLGQRILVSQVAGNRKVQKLVAIAVAVIILLPVLVIAAFMAAFVHVMDVLHIHARPTVRLGVDAYRAAEVCPFASDGTVGSALGTAYLLGSAYVITTLPNAVSGSPNPGNLTQWGGYRNPVGSPSDIPADMLVNTDPAELRAGGSVHDELELQGNYQPSDWTTVLPWTHLPVIGWTPALWGGEHGVGFLLILPSQWRSWLQDVPAALAQHLDPFKPVDSFLVMACHLKHIEDQNGYGMAGVFNALISFGDDTVMQLINTFVDAIAEGVGHLLDAIKALWHAFVSNGATFANAVADYMGGGQHAFGQVLPSPAALADIPPDYLRLILHWADSFGMDWTILAGVLKVECDFGRCPNPVSSAGAEGPAQFLPGTWILEHLPGLGNIWAANDAIAAAAHYLTQLGVNQDPAAALCGYWAGPAAHLQACAYADQVMSYARRYRGPASGAPVGNPGRAAEVAVQAAASQLGIPYVWGGESPGQGFDWSGLVQWAYAQAGIQLPRTSEAQWAAGPRLPPGQPLQPGDLVFFDDGVLAPPGHVGIAISGTQMIDAPFTGQVVRIDSFSTGQGYMGATRPAAR